MTLPASDADLTDFVQAAVVTAFATGTPLRVRAGGTKDFYGRTPQGSPLEVAGHRGIVEYEPTELVVTARSGTPIDALDAMLQESHQILAFEPPRFGPGATLGGTIACGLSGPRRPYAGAVRDFVLGVRIVNGRGEVLRFGGRVMKNVAGYDISRLTAGALGTLGVLLEASLKVLPAPPGELTLVQELDPGGAVEAMNRYAGLPLPLSAAAHWEGRLYLRLSGSASGVEGARRTLGGEPVSEGVWAELREHRLPFFEGDRPLWRLSVPPASAPLDLPGSWVLDWGGGQRWLRTDADPERVRTLASALGGHATLFRGGDRSGEVFHPLAVGIATLHRRLKQAFDPRGILNPGRLYRDL